MPIISFCMKKYRAQIYRVGLLKLNSMMCWDICSTKNILSTSAAAVCHPLHTVPILQESFSCGIQPVLENDSDCMNVRDSPFSIRNQKLECGLINYITIVNIKELWKPDSFSDELLACNEFKSVLSRCYLHYDVSVVNHSATEHLLSSASLGSWNLLSEQSPFHQVFPVNTTVLSQSFETLQCEKVENTKSNPEKSEKPSEDQLLSIINRLCHSLLNFFEQSHDFSMYHKNIVFQNNIKGISTKGIMSYIQQMYLMKIYGHIHYAKVKVEILKITHHTEDGTVRVRWRVNGISRRRMLMLLWKSKNSSQKKIIEEDPEWLDGFSVFSVGPDGLIHKHVCDKMIPDNEELLPKRNSFSTKLLVLLGLSQRPSTVNDLNAMLVLSPIDDSFYNFILPAKTK